MLVYIGAYAIMLLFAAVLQYNKTNKKQMRGFICILSALILVVILGLRHPSMGNDLRYGESGGYLSAFTVLASKSWKEIFLLDTYLNYEKGYIIFNKFIGVFSRNQQFFLFVCSLVSMLPIFYVIYKKSENPLISTVIFMGLPSFLMIYSGLRQAIAMSLCFLAVIFTQEKKPIKFLLTVLLAWTFHSSAIIFLVAYPIYHIKLKSKLRWFSLLLIPVVYLLRVPIFNIVGKYFSTSLDQYGEGSITLFLVFILIYLFCIVFKDDSKEQNGLMNLFLIACCCQAFGSVFHLAMRLTYYFMMALILLLPSTLKHLKLKKNEKIVVISLIVLVFIIYGLYSLYTSTWAQAYPYHWFWESI